MRVAVVTSSPPFSEGGHLVIARSLVQALEEAGHRPTLVLTPQNRFGRQASAYLANWLTDVGLGADDRPIDQVISLRFPSYAVRHPTHVCWLNHTMREDHDLWDRFSDGLSPQGRMKERIRRTLIRSADRYLLGRLTKLFAQSTTVQTRLERSLRIPSEVLYPPPPQRPYRCEGYGDFIFCVSRLAPLKRVDLILRALAEPAARGIRCVIAGDGEEEPALQTLIRELGLDERVQLVGRLSEDALVDHLARCRAVCFPPFEEDYGFVSVEAFASGKAIVTCRDSGGPAELAAATGGFVVEPTPTAVADALRRLMDDATLAQQLGERAQLWARRLTWAAAVNRLLVA